MGIILLGPPGAGKGTQAVLLAKKRNIPHISSGEIMRAAVSAGTDLGKAVRERLDRGELVPDDLVIQVMGERLAQSDCKPGFVLDGFPRTVAQAEALTGLLKKLGLKISHVLELDVPESVLIERINLRGKAGSGRSDDTVEVAVRRLHVYWQQTAPVSRYYRDNGALVKVNGLGTVQEVNERLLEAFN